MEANKPRLGAMPWIITHVCATALIVVSITMAAWQATPAAQSAQPVRAITNIRGDLYRVQDDGHATVFLVTSDGIILGDPIRVDAAAWLKRELAARFPNRPVRYVIFSHHDFDHASGGNLFKETAQLVGHVNFNQELDNALAGRDEFFLRADADRSGRMEGREFEGRQLALNNDRNGDGIVTPSELMADVARVESTYEDRRTMVLGGKRVELIHPGTAHASDMTVLYFPAERTVFAVDFLALRSFPASVTSPAEYIAAIRRVEALDFDILVAGHREVGTKADVIESRRYLEELLAAVTEGVKAGRTLEEMQTSLVMAKYKDWFGYPMRKNQNIADTYRALRPTQ